jgi:hypothetical protein
MKKMKKVPNWIFSLKKKIVKSWKHHSLCESVNISSKWDENLSCWVLEAHPVFQEIIGGKEDGERVWSGFLFDFLMFSRFNGVWIKQCFVQSLCTNSLEEDESENIEISPSLMIKGKFYGNKFALSVLLEPSEDSETVESVDYKNNVVARRN